MPLCPICTASDEEKERSAPPPKPSPTKWKEGGEEDEEDEKGWVSEWEGKPLVKPDIVFFGWVAVGYRNGERIADPHFGARREMLSDEFDHRLLEDREEVDLIIVIGTSLRVSCLVHLTSEPD